MTEIQERLLGLLLEIDGICKANGIEYYLDGGSALGAVRHRGFLPWDDDADIMFTRDNWLKFRKAVRENPLPNRTIEGLDNCPEYTMVYARYCATDTTCILRTSMIDQFRSGLFVDLFVLDPIPDTPEGHKHYFDVLWGYAEYLNPYYYDTVVGNNDWYRICKKLDAAEGRQAVTEMVEREIFSHPDREGMTYGFRYDNGRFIYPRHVVGSPRYVPYENTYLPVAQRVEDYLRIHYGDNWHIIPPPGEEEGHNVAIDVHVPYETFRDAYMPHIDRPQAKKAYEQLHQLRLEQRTATDFVDRNNYVVAAELLARLIRRNAGPAGRMKQYLTDGRYDEVRRVLGNYFTMQLNRWFMYHRVSVPLEDECLYAALYLLMIEGRYGHADKILTLRKEQAAPLSEDLRSIEGLIAGIRRVVRLLEEKNYSVALQLSNDLLAEHPDVVLLAESDLRARGQLAIASDDAAEAERIIAAIDEVPHAACVADRLCATRQFLRYRFGTAVQKEAAADALRRLRAATADGMLRLEIADLLNNES